MPRSASHASRSETMLAACGDPGLEMMPTVSMACMQQKFFIPFSAGYGTFHQSSGEAERLHRLQNSVTRRPVQFRLAYNAALSDLTAADLKLGLDEYNHFSTF